MSHAPSCYCFGHRGKEEKIVSNKFAVVSNWWLIFDGHVARNNIFILWCLKS